MIVCHLFGDYVLQSHFMATEKTKRSAPALAHVIAYTLPFIFLTRSPWALVFIGGTHFVIDRWRLARYVCWAKNFLSPRVWWHPWGDCSGTGYAKDQPAWLAVWLMIIADQGLHLLCNGIALSVWRG